MKKSILYCDDQEGALKNFITRHNDFEVDTISDIQELIPRLDNMKKLPDLLLLDLYHPRNKMDIDYQDKVGKLIDPMLKEITEKINEVKKCVDKAWVPSGISTIQNIRRHYPAYKLPIMIYTRIGLFFLEDDQVLTLENLGTEWLIKDPERISFMTESNRIYRYIEKCKESHRLPRDFKMAVFGAVISIVRGYF